MLKKLLKLGLIVGLSVASLGAETFQKGDAVIIKSGHPVCFALEQEDAYRNLTGLGRLVTDYSIDFKNGNMPKLSLNKKSSYCAFYKNELKYKFTKMYNNKYAILDSKDYWIVVHKSSLKKASNQPEKSNEPTYSFLGIDDLEAFPSDYVGKLTFLKCKRSTPTEDTKNGGYTIMATCAKADGKYGFGGNNPFKIQIHTNSILPQKNQTTFSKV